MAGKLLSSAIAGLLSRCFIGSVYSSSSRRAVAKKNEGEGDISWYRNLDPAARAKCVGRDVCRTRRLERRNSALISIEQTRLTVE